VLQKVRQKIVAVIRDDLDRVGFTNCKRVHDDFVRVSLETEAGCAFEVIEIMRDLVSQQLKPLALNGENAGVDPVAGRFHGIRNTKELRLDFTRLPTLCLDHKLVRIDERYIGNEQGREVDLRHEHRVEIDVHDLLGFTSQNGKEFRKDCSDTWSVIETRLSCAEDLTQIVSRYEAQCETMAGSLLIRGQDLEGPLIVGGDENVVGVFVREITLETRELLLDH